MCWKNFHTSPSSLPRRSRAGCLACLGLLASLTPENFSHIRGEIFHTCAAKFFTHARKSFSHMRGKVFHTSPSSLPRTARAAGVTDAGHALGNFSHIAEQFAWHPSGSRSVWRASGCWRHRHRTCAGKFFAHRGAVCLAPIGQVVWHARAAGVTDTGLYKK